MLRMPLLRMTMLIYLVKRPKRKRRLLMSVLQLSKHLERRNIGFFFVQLSNTLPFPIPSQLAGKSSVLLDVKPWDDETDMKKLEEAVGSVTMDGLLWGASQLVAVGYGIKKLQIMMTIVFVDDLVSVDNLIE